MKGIVKFFQQALHTGVLNQALGMAGTGIEKTIKCNPESIYNHPINSLNPNCIESLEVTNHDLQWIHSLTKKAFSIKNKIIEKGLFIDPSLAEKFALNTIVIPEIAKHNKNRKFLISLAIMNMVMNGTLNFKDLKQENLSKVMDSKDIQQWLDYHIIPQGSFKHENYLVDMGYLRPFPFDGSAIAGFIGDIYNDYSTIMGASQASMYQIFEYQEQREEYTDKTFQQILSSKGSKNQNAIIDKFSILENHKTFLQSEEGFILPRKIIRGNYLTNILILSHDDSLEPKDGSCLRDGIKFISRRSGDPWDHFMNMVRNVMKYDNIFSNNKCNNVNGTSSVHNSFASAGVCLTTDTFGQSFTEKLVNKELITETNPNEFLPIGAFAITTDNSLDILSSMGLTDDQSKEALKILLGVEPKKGK
ncbi:hypothetical protein ACFLZV_07485 [Candidatus Margulisiibacteriota bacterium]